MFAEPPCPTQTLRSCLCSSHRRLHGPCRYRRDAREPESSQHAGHSLHRHLCHSGWSERQHQDVCWTMVRGYVANGEWLGSAFLPQSPSCCQPAHGSWLHQLRWRVGAITPLQSDRPASRRLRPVQRRHIQFLQIATRHMFPSRWRATMVVNNFDRLSKNEHCS